ncbi:RNA polymerase factor sigma-54 [Mesorhizobium sp. WSM3626]|uniref:RNA polymerase factor sigma-54 n=1 Tax=Mesorhizobium sp. WSM3626 TaxID=1040987 RepID=UPI000485AC89|nr:RNA polymerase factor sigma-54 [Mesorhizobium sp. WSM3626]
MKSSASLLLSQKQSLVLTPQLIESIRLLQLAHTELRQFVEQEVEKNPLLELTTNDSEADDDFSSVLGEDPPRGERENGAEPSERLREEKSTRDTPASGSGEDVNPEAFVANPETLHEHVARQIALTAFNSQERMIAGALANHLVDTGYLPVDLLELAGILNVPLSVVERVLAALQLFDPPGLFGRTVRECLEIQLRQQDRFDPAMATLVANLQMVADRDFKALQQLCGVDEEDLLDMLHELRALDPKPGHRFQSGGPESIQPEVWVQPSREGGWNVELDPNTLPKVLINESYFVEVSRLTAQNPKDQAFLNECMENANWLVRSLDQRAKTIIKVAAEIVHQQDAFLRHGVTHLRPLNLRTVADAINMHESTVSRVTSNKYISTPRGVFELKYFFTVAIGSCEGGDAHSAEAVRHQIKAMIAAEDAVLSDEEIAVRLRENGIDLARRTVMKYREAMNIPSSVQRRREKRGWP